MRGRRVLLSPLASLVAILYIRRFRQFARFSFIELQTLAGEISGDSPITSASANHDPPERVQVAGSYSESPMDSQDLPDKLKPSHEDTPKGGLVSRGQESGRLILIGSNYPLNRT
jgi:hypothetical protein